MYPCQDDIIHQADSPIKLVLGDLGSAPEQISEDQNKLVNLRMRLSDKFNPDGAHSVAVRVSA